MAKKFSLLSLFSDSDSSAQRGAKSDGKGVAELKAENNTDAAKNIRHSTKISATDTANTAIQNNKKKRYGRHARRLNKPERKQFKENTEEKKHSKRFTEVQNATYKANRETKRIKKRNNVPEIEIRKFVQSLDPSVQEAIRKDIVKQMEQKQSQVKKSTKKKTKKQQPEALPRQALRQESDDMQQRIAAKRGINPKSKRLQMLENAKKVAENARKFVKDFRVRVLNKDKKPAQKQTVQTKRKQKFNNKAKHLAQNKGRE